ncbi:MAG TPA: thrombospondin type 3 repeat-containing protein [Candidatus Binatia bacterium]|jgi:hypothetical protein|nr:thrombospondin type 3 repeat-containing protein [Candidatus Binatia bacterium]
MRSRHRLGFGALAIIMGLLLGGASLATACPADDDGDGVCNALDNCPALANADQADLDGDTIGDVCDGADAELNTTKLTLKRDSSPTNDSSSIKGKGDFFTAPPVDILTAASGITIHVQDSLHTNFSHTFTPAECAEGGGKILCVSTDKTCKLTLRALKPTPQVFRYVLTMKRVGLVGPFNWPVVVTMTNGAIDRAGEIVDCRVTNTSLVCREF